MKYIKTSVCSLVTLSLFSYVHSVENDSLWTELRSKLKVLPKPGNSQEARIREPKAKIDESFSAIEKDLKCVFPESVKRLHTEAGNLAFPDSVCLLSPVGETESYLYRCIVKGRTHKLPSDWLIFAEIDGQEYFCINRLTGNVSRFTLIPHVKMHDSYVSIEDWAQKMFLTI